MIQLIAIAGAIGTGLFKAIRTVILRIGVFYAGSVLRLCLLLPYTSPTPPTRRASAALCHVLRVDRR